MNIFQLSAEDIQRSSTLEPEDIGKWCFVMNGCIMGFFDTHDEAQDSLNRYKVHTLSAKFNREVIGLDHGKQIRTPPRSPGCEPREGLRDGQRSRVAQ